MLKAVGLALIAAVALVGCQSGPSVVGKWNSTIQGVPGTYEFTSDGKMTQEAVVMGIKAKVSGTYKLEKEKLLITPQNLDAPGLPKQILDMAKGQMGKEVVSTIKFSGSDEFIITVGSQSQTFTRAK